MTLKFSGEDRHTKKVEIFNTNKVIAIHGMTSVCVSHLNVLFKYILSQFLGGLSLHLNHLIA